MTSARGELFRAFGALAEPPTPAHAALAEALGLPEVPAAADYADTFLFSAYPYASVFVGEEGMLGGEARDRIAGFWSALGLTPPPEPDHLAALLGLYGALADAEAEEREAGDEARASLRRISRRALLWEHLLSWLPAYLAKVREVGTPAYGAWAELVDAALREEALELGGPDRLPLHLREAPGLPAPDASLAEWVGAILAPVRSGVLLTRTDLRRGGIAIGTGSRVGERAFVLRSLLEADMPGTLAWLRDEAAAAAERHGAGEPAFGPVTAFWRERADASRAAFELARAGTEGQGHGDRHGA